MDQPSGREDLTTDEICQDFLSDPEPTYIGQITTDGDSAAYRGVQKAIGEHEKTVEIPATSHSPRGRLSTTQSSATRCFLDEQPVTGTLPKKILCRLHEAIQSRV